MKPHSYSSEGIILGRRNFSEADRIISIYSKDGGRISLIAKGVRRPSSRKRGHIEIFNLVKYQATVGHGIDMMLEAEVINDFKNIRKSLNKISLAYYFMEVVGRITHEGEPNEELFDLILLNLTKLEKTKALKDLRISFLNSILTTLGYWPKGVVVPNPDEKLEEVIERQIYSKRVGKIISS